MSYIHNPTTGGGGGGPFQPLDADLTAIAALSGTGIACRIANNTWALRTVVDAGSTRISVTNPGGVAGNITLDVNESALDLGALGGQVAWTTQIDFTGSNLTDLATRSHSDLQNLLADDHPQYFLLAGRSSGQLGIGGTSSGDTLTFRSNASQDGQIILGDDASKAEYVNVHGPTSPWAATGGHAVLRTIGVDRGLIGQNIALLNGSFYGPSIFGYAHRGTVLSPTVVGNVDVLMQFATFGYTGAGGYAFASTMGFRVDDPSPGPGAMGSLFFVQTTDAGTASPVDRFTIDNTGVVKVFGSGLTINGLAYIWPSSTSATTVLQNDGSNNLSWVSLSGTFQPLDADLTALAGLTTTGIIVRTGAGTATTRTLAVTDSASVDFTLTNGDGVAGNPTITAVVLPAGVDHNSLANLTVGDPHTQYLLLAGRSGGQIANGGTASGDDLSLISTSNSTKGSIFLDTNMEIQADFAATAGSETRTLLNWAKTVNIFGSSNVVNLIKLAPDFTLNNSVPGEIIWFNADGTLTETANTIASLAVPFKITTRSVSNTNGSVPHALHNFWCTPVFELQTGTASASATIPGFWENIVVSAINGSSLTYTPGALEAFRSTPSMIATGNSAALVYQRAGVHIADIAYSTSGSPRGTISLAYNRGVQIDNFVTGGQGGTVTVTEMTAFWTSMASGTGKWALLGTGTADSSLGGRLFVGSTGSTVPSTSLDVDGDFAMRAANLGLSNGNNDNIAIGARSFIRVTGPTGAFVIRGIASGFNGKRLVIYNTTTQNMTINHEDAGSTAANRIRTMNAASPATTGEGLAEFVYDATLQRWLLLYLTA